MARSGRRDSGCGNVTSHCDNPHIQHRGHPWQSLKRRESGCGVAGGMSEVESLEPWQSLGRPDCGFGSGTCYSGNPQLRHHGHVVAFHELGCRCGLRSGGARDNLSAS